MMTDGILTAQLSGNVLGAQGRGLTAESVQRFQEAYGNAAARLEHQGIGQQATANRSEGLSTLLNPLLGLNSDSTRLAQHAQHATQTEMKPSELMQFTMRSHEFLFHCELVSNVANRSSDGMQQLFRQQS